MKLITSFDRLTELLLIVMDGILNKIVVTVLKRFFFFSKPSMTNFGVLLHVQCFLSFFQINRCSPVDGKSDHGQSKQQGELFSFNCQQPLSGSEARLFQLGRRFWDSLSFKELGE